MSRLTRRYITFFTLTGLSPSLVKISILFWLFIIYLWPGPVSLATTSGVSVDFLSSGYLDVSVPRVRFIHLFIQCMIHKMCGFPHSDIDGSQVVRTFPSLFAAYHVLHRLLVPRHSPNALIALDLFRFFYIPFGSMSI